MLLGPSLGVSALLFAIGVGGVLLQPERHRDVHVRRVDAQRRQPLVRRPRPAARRRRPSHGVLRDDRGRGGSGRRARRSSWPSIATRTRSTCRTSTCSRVIPPMLDWVWLVVAAPVPGLPRQRGAGVLPPEGAKRAMARSWASASWSWRSSSPWPSPRVCGAPQRGTGRWCTSGPGSRLGAVDITLTFQVDALSIVMLLVVTGVGMLIHVFSIGYMRRIRATRATSPT